MKRGIYAVTSLAGEAMTEGEIQEALAEAANSKVFRAMMHILEDELIVLRGEACDPQNLKEGTQAHWNGAVDGLNGAMVRIAEVCSGTVNRARKRREPAQSSAD